MLLSNWYFKHTYQHYVLINNFILGLNGGASDGTNCASGKSCLNGQCVASPQAPIGNCLYGDDLVSSVDLAMNLPTSMMTCSDTIQFLISIGMDPVFYCQSQSYSFSSTCCNTCAGN